MERLAPPDVVSTLRKKEKKGPSVLILVIFCVVAEPSGRVSSTQIHTPERGGHSRRLFGLRVLLTLAFCGKTRSNYW